MKQRFLSLMAVLFAFTSYAQTYQERAQLYIAKFKDLAISEQQRTGVPAAIKLGQGILETNAGSSELAMNARNHFGIKCKSNWTGDTYSYTDDAPDECFRKYSLDIESYRDHSDFLKNNKRYASCFRLEQTDYKSWARELRKCGYATNPRYADQLIKVIEDFGLQEMTYAALMPPKQPSVVLASAAATPVVDPAPAITLPVAGFPEATPMTGNADTIKFPSSLPYGRRITNNGLDGFYARKGQLLLESAIKFNIRYAKLLELNDLPDAPLPADMFIYLEKKKSTGSKPTHVVAAGESLLQIAQAEGIQLKALRRLNHLENNDEPAPGAVLQLQQATIEKPATAAYVYQAPEAKSASADESVFIAGGKKTVAENSKDLTAEARQEARETQVETPATDAVTARVNIANERAVDETDEDEEEAAAEPVAGHQVTATVPSASASAGDEIDLLKARMDKAVYSQPAPAAKPAIAAGTTPVSTPAVVGQYHTVAAGETAFSIARKYNITMKQLIDWNQLDFGKIKVGQKLRVK